MSTAFSAEDFPIDRKDEKRLSKEFIPGRPTLPFYEALAARDLGLGVPHAITWGEIDVMRSDATIDASIELLKELILAEELQIIAQPFDDEEKAKKAHDIAEFVNHALPKNLFSTFNNLLEAVYYGYSVGELVYALFESGQYKGKLKLAAIKIKDKDAIELVVDKFWNVEGIKSRAAGIKSKVYPRNKFIILSLRKRGEDPRGTTCLRQIFGAWRFKQEIWPAYVRFMRTCAIPTLVGELPEDARPQPRLNSDGTPTIVDGQPVFDMPAVALLNTLQGMENAMVAVVANGTKVIPIEISSNAPLFSEAVEVANREIVLGLLRQTRATTEAQHSSKADSETGRSLLSFFVAHMRRTIGEVILSDIIRPLVLYNFGFEALDLLPSVDMGETDRYDWAPDARAASMLASSLTDSQWDATTTMLGLPLPLPDEERPPRRLNITNIPGNDTEGDGAAQNSPKTPNSPQRSVGSDQNT